MFVVLRCWMLLKLNNYRARSFLFRCADAERSIQNKLQNEQMVHIYLLPLRGSEVSTVKD